MAFVSSFLRCDAILDLGAKKSFEEDSRTFPHDVTAAKDHVAPQKMVQKMRCLENVLANTHELD